MRISDWSSDVCSSDLRVGANAVRFEQAAADRFAAAGDLDDAVARGRLPFAHDGVRGGGKSGISKGGGRSEEHTSELQSLMRISYAVFCLKKKINKQKHTRLHSKDETAHNETTQKTK